MLFNLDNESKQKMFNEYKQEALDFKNRKLLEKQKRIEEEKEYLKNIVFYTKVIK